MSGGCKSFVKNEQLGRLLKRVPRGIRETLSSDRPTFDQYVSQLLASLMSEPLAKFGHALFVDTEVGIANPRSAAEVDHV